MSVQDLRREKERLSIEGCKKNALLRRSFFFPAQSLLRALQAQIPVSQRLPTGSRPFSHLQFSAAAVEPSKTENINTKNGFRSMSAP